jgi:hypothetical protein
VRAGAGAKQPPRTHWTAPQSSTGSSTGPVETAYQRSSLKRKTYSKDPGQRVLLGFDPDRSQPHFSKFKSPIRLPRALRALAHEAVVTEDRPHRRVRAEQGASRFRCHPRRPCHWRAIHSGLDRSRADNHGQRRSSIDLRGVTPLQVTIAADLALGAGGRGFKSGRPDQNMISAGQRPAVLRSVQHQAEVTPACEADRCEHSARSHSNLPALFPARWAFLRRLVHAKMGGDGGR